MKALFLVSHIDSTNGICVQTVAKRLVEKGVEVHILTQSNQTAEDMKKAENGICVYTVSENPISKQMKRAGAMKGRLGTVFASMYKTIHRLWVLLCYPCWPMTSPLRAWKFSNKAAEIVKEKNIDVIIPIYGSVETLLAANSTKKQIPQVKLVPYFLDALLAGQTPRLMKPETKQKKAIWWEKKLLSNADGIVMMNAAKKCYEDFSAGLDYYDRITFLDIPMLLMQNNGEKSGQRRNFPKDETVFFFAGAMARNIRDPRKTLEIFMQTKNPQWRLYLAGTSDYMSAVEESAKKDSRIRFLGKLPHAQVREMMEEADFLVNIGNTLSYMVPSKIFEYMAFEKPIVSTCKLKDDPSLPYLEAYKKIVILDEQSDVVASAAQLEHFVADVSTGKLVWTSLADLTEVDAPLYNNTPDAFGRYLEKILQ